LLLLCGCDFAGGAHAPTSPGIARAEASFECASAADTSALVRHPMPIGNPGDVYFDVPPGFTVFGFPPKALTARSAALYAKLPQDNFTVMGAIGKRFPYAQWRQHPANSSDPNIFDLLPPIGGAYGSPGMSVSPLRIEPEGHDSSVRCG
jgi:hypothetical protein